METATVKENKDAGRHELYINGKLMAYVVDKDVKNPKKLLGDMAKEKGYAVIFEDHTPGKPFNEEK